MFAQEESVVKIIIQNVLKKEIRLLEAQHSITNVRDLVLLTLLVHYYELRTHHGVFDGGESCMGEAGVVANVVASCKVFAAGELGRTRRVRQGVRGSVERKDRVGRILLPVGGRLRRSAVVVVGMGGVCALRGE